MTSLWKVVATSVAMVAFVWFGEASHAAPPVKVELATPSSGEQGTLDLDVEIAGSGFEAGAAVDFLVTGSNSDKGNVVVKQVTFHHSKKLTAKVSLENAKLSDFDVKVTLKSGRNGKGISLFKVVAKGAGNGDSTAPASIDNITVSPLVLALRLTFVAPGDDGFAGTASGYDLEYKTYTGDCTGSWIKAPGIDNTKPAAGGVLDSLPVQGLLPGTRYCVRVRARDEASNWSPWKELTASTEPGSWSSELVSGPRDDELGTRLFAAATRVVGDADGVNTHVVWASAPIPAYDSPATGRKLTIASGSGGQWVLRDVVRDVNPSRVFVRARPGGGVGVLVLGYVVVNQKASYRVILVETTPTAGGGYSLTESVVVQGIGDHASPLVYGPDGTLWFAYTKLVQINKKTTVSNVTLRRRDPSGTWSEQTLLSSAVQGPELVVAPDGGLAVAASACGRTLYGRQDTASGTWRFYRSAATSAYVSGHAVVFEPTDGFSIFANSSSSPGNISSVIRYRNTNLEFDPVLTVAANQLPANISTICGSTAPTVEPPAPDVVLMQENSAPLSNALWHAGVSVDSSGVHLRAMRWWNDLGTLLVLSDCGNGWQTEAVDIGSMGFTAPWHSERVLDANGDAIAAYAPEPAGTGAFASPASSIRLSKRVGNACSGPP
jgi:hypothetical protein